MESYRTVLFPTDGSENANRAIEHGLKQVVGTGTTVHVLYVIRPFQALLHDPQSPKQHSALEKTEVDLQKVAEAAIEEFVERVRRETNADIEIEYLIRRGVIPEEIIDYAETHDIDLIVMGTSGRTGLSRYALGSVTERVLRRADIPVLVV